MSDSGSDSGTSSGDSIPSRRASVQHGEANGGEITNDTENKGGMMEESNKVVEDAASNSDTASVSTKGIEDEILHLEWQHDQSPHDSNLDIRLIDFVVIPGVYANWETTGPGESPGSGSSAWVTNFAKEGCDKIPSPGAPEDSCRVLRFDYESSELFSGHRSREAIHRIALRLLNSLRSKRRGQGKKRLIYFISHDVGGAIVKDALVTASLDRDSWQDISEMTRVLIFNGYPHRHKDATDLKTRLASFLYENWSQDSGKPRPSSTSISGLAKAFIQVNGIFIASHVALRSWIINLHSYGDKSNGSFDAYCATLGIPLEKRLPAPTDSENSSLILYLAKMEPDVREPRGQVVEPRQYVQERKLLALASPIYPLRNEVQSNPLADLPDYQSWLKCPSPQILYIHGSHAARDVAESVFHALEDEATKVKRRANVLYFSFDRWDVRADSIRDMIATFLAQICNHHPKLGPAINRLCSQIDNERGWTETDLIQFFEMFRISPEVEQTMIVINHFDECSKGSRKRFLDHVIQKYYNDETPWKIVVTSHEPGALSEELSGPFCVPIDITSGELGNVAQDSFESDLQGFLRSRGDLAFQEGQIRDELCFAEKLEPSVRRVIFEQLKVRDEWPDEISTDEVFGSLKFSQQTGEGDKSMASVLNVVLRQCSDQDSLERLLSWLLYAVRPLTIWELATVISFSDERERCRISPSFMAVDKLLEKIENDFAGILEVNHNEIRFKHPCLHEIMVSGDSSSQTEEEKSYLWNRVKGTAHTLIQDMCLDYLSRDAVQEYVKKTFAVPDSSTFETPTFPDRTNLASYAIQAWAHHYSLSSPLPDLSALSSKRDFVQILARAHWCLANPATKRSPCFQSLFPIFAGLGLPNVVEPLGSDDALRGLIEAASKEQKNVVEDLLGAYDFTPAEIWDVLQAASSSGNGKLMNSLLDKIEAKSEIPRDFEWPAVLVYRAANLGLRDFAERILSLGCSPDPDVEWRNSTCMHASPLYLAACHGYTATVRVLLKHGASFDFASYSWRNPLHKAALEGHAETVKAILEESKVNIDCISESNFTALYLAVLGGNHTTVKLLLEKGADPNMGIPDTYTGHDQWTPLIAATDDGFKKCIRLLLDNGANPNMSGPSGPPLHWAVAQCRVDILDMLLEAGANPRSELLQQPLLFTALSAMMKVADLAMLERLLELELDVNCKGRDEATVLAALALAYGDEPIDDSPISCCHRQKDKAFKMLLDHGADPNLASDNSATPLRYAVIKEQYHVVEMLLEAGADPNTTSPGCGSPLACASEKQPDMVRLLLQKGADPDLPFGAGFTPLTHAACFGYEKTVEILLEYGATVDLEYGEGVAEPLNDWLKGWTPLMCAANQGYGEIVRLLAEAGSDLARRDIRTSRSIVHLAIYGGTLSALLEFPSRIDLNTTTDDGLGVLHYRDLKPQDLKRLVNAGADIEIGDTKGNTPLQVYAGCDLEKVQYIVKRGANVNHGTNHTGTPLHRACRAGRFDIIKFLVENGGNVNATCDFLGTPLQALFLAQSTVDPTEHESMGRYLLSGDRKTLADVTIKAGVFGYAVNAAAFGSIPCLIDLILDHDGATVDVKDNMGRMPIHMAACNGLANFEAILARGGDINAKDNQGRTPLHWAAQTGKLQVVRKIISLMDDKLDIDVPDIGGWTPLCWAPRHGLKLLKHENAGEPSRAADVVRLLLEHGAKRNVVAKQGEEAWTPLNIAHYHRSDPEIVSVLESGIETDEDVDRNADDKEGKEAKAGHKIGVQQEGFCCDYCLSLIYGLFWSCETCNWFCLCAKCYQHADTLHHEHDDFTLQGEEECEEDEQEASATGTTGSSDIYSNSDSGSDESEGGEDEDGEKEEEKENVEEDNP